jgi:hypothetical protein
MISLSTDDIASGIEDIVRIRRKKIAFKLMCSEYHKRNDNSICYNGHECWLFIDTYDTSLCETDS